MDKHDASAIKIFFAAIALTAMFAMGTCTYMGVECVKAGKEWHAGSGDCRMEISE